MPVPIVTTITFDPQKGPIKVSLDFDTMFLCTYEFDLREAKTNDSVRGFPGSGDNANPQLDEFELPKPTSKNNGRKGLAFINILDQTGNGGTYECSKTYSQDGITLGSVSTGKKKISGNVAVEILAAKLVAK